MGDVNLIHTLEDYSKPSHEGYKNTIELPVGNNVVPLRSDTICNCNEDCKVKFATGTLTEKDLSWWNSFAQPIGIEEAYKVTWSEFKKLLIKKFCPRTEELEILCPTMVPNSEKLMEVFIGGLPRSIEGNITASKPQTLDEAINITHRNQCPKANNNTHGRAYLIRDKNAHQDLNVVTGTFLLNQHLATVLFYSGADKSFISISLASMLNIPPNTIDTIYDIEMADGNLYHTKILCDKKVVHIPIDGETLIIRAQVMEKKLDKKRLEDIQAVREFPEVFPEDAPAVFMDLMNCVCKPYLDKFVIVFIDDTFIYTRNKEEHANHLRIILELLRKEKLYAKFSKCDFWISIVQFLKHVIDSQGIHVAHAKIEAVKNWGSSTTPTDVHQFLGISGYYQRFIKGFSKIEKSLTVLNQKNKNYIWGKDQESAFQLLKQNLCEAPILALPQGNEDFVVYCDASLQDRLTKSAHFIPTRETDSMETLTWLYIKEIVSRHKVPISIISDRDSHFTSIFWKSMQSVLGTQLDTSTVYHPETDGQSKRTIQTLEDMLQACVIDFGKELPEELSNVHSTFYVSNLKKCISNESLVILMKELRLNEKLNFMEEPIEIMDQEVKQLRQSRIPIVKKGEYDIWAMKMEHYLAHTDYRIWEIIQQGNGLVQVSTDTKRQIRFLPPKTAEEILARERERKARTTLLMAIPEDHLAKVHKTTDAKEMWEAIKSRFEGLYKGYDRFQSLLSQLQIHGVGVSTEDANQKFLRPLPSSWSQVSMIMRTKPGVDTLSFNDLYKNLRVFESDVKGSTASSSNIQNVAFISSDSTNSTAEVSTTYSVSTSSGHNSQKECFSSYTDDLMYSFFANQSNGPQLDHEDLEQVDEYKARDNGRRPAKHDEHKAMVTIDGEGVDWTGHAEDDTKNYALMAFNSGPDTEMSAKDKSGLGYGNQIHEGALSYENEVLESVFDSRSSDVEDSPVNDRFEKVKGMHTVPPSMIGIYMPPKFDFKIDESKFTYVPKQSKSSESNAKTSDLASCEYYSRVETLESMPKPIESKPKVVSKLKVWSDVPIIEEYESDSNDEYVFKAPVEQEKSSCAFINTVKHVKTPSFSHLIRDCDFHKKIMAKQVELNKRKNKVTCQRNDRPVWNNMQRLNHQNKFVPTAILTKTGRFPVNAARQNFSSQAASTSTVRKVNTARPIMDEIRLRNNVYKSHSRIRRPFNRTTAPKANFANHKENTVGDKTDNPHQTLKGKGIVDIGCSRHMTGNKAYLVEYQNVNGGPVAFGGSKGQITGKGKIRTGKLDFEDVYFVKELQHFNLFSVSQMCDKKKKVLFTDTECLVLSPDLKLPDENQVLLRVPRQNNMYSFNLENIIPSGDSNAYQVSQASNSPEKNKLKNINIKLSRLVTLAGDERGGDGSGGVEMERKPLRWLIKTKRTRGALTKPHSPLEVAVVGGASPGRGGVDGGNGRWWLWLAVRRREEEELMVVTGDGNVVV
uniref:Putative reverse transcriptase domain-containing protein n=1 Tax=Tanacetum cinerariifolium TaxID=118510 RepID=A0A6L2P6T0_TANCI|nr:putative reverse transcriptase domain-containing protein [Tanacetum cinerariifolium]